MAVSAAATKGEVLFNGKNLEGWTTLDGEPIIRGWKVVEGMIYLDPRDGDAGHIITRREFGDLELSFEWKITSGGNSGVKYRVRDYGGKWYGCEYQILDDLGYRKRFLPRQSAGALYDLYAPLHRKQLQSVGSFNRGRIVSHGNVLKHWLNNQLVVSTLVGSEDWTRRVANSKFADLPDFGMNRRGRIMLTDHGSAAWPARPQHAAKLEVMPRVCPKSEELLKVENPPGKTKGS